MEISCECGQWRAEISNFPKENPGRLGCYCDDCQAFAVYMKRTELLDKAGMTEIVPVYPQNLKILSGQSNMQCMRLGPDGLLRWYTSCCNTPIGNTAAGSPWVGVPPITFKRNRAALEKSFSQVKSRIMGRFAKGAPAPGTAQKLNFRAFRSVMPFMLKGFIGKRYMNSPFFKEDGKTPIVEPKVISKAEREELMDRVAKTAHY